MVALCEDTTYLKCKKSNDCSVQVTFLHQCCFNLCLQSDFYSGSKNHGQCVQVGNICDPEGRCWAVQPGILDYILSITLVISCFHALASQVFKQAAPQGWVMERWLLKFWAQQQEQELTWGLATFSGGHKTLEHVG